MSTEMYRQNSSLSEFHVVGCRGTETYNTGGGNGPRKGGIDHRNARHAAAVAALSCALQRARPPSVFVYSCMQYFDCLEVSDSKDARVTSCGLSLTS